MCRIEILIIEELDSIDQELTEKKGSSILHPWMIKNHRSSWESVPDSKFFLISELWYCKTILLGVPGYPTSRAIVPRFDLCEWVA